MDTMRRLTFALAVSIAIGSGFVANNAQSDAAAPVPAALAMQPQPAAEPERGRTVQIEVFSKADGSPLAGATVWVARRVRPHSHLGG